MKEFSWQNIGEVEEKGRVVKRDLMLTIDMRTYLLSVATPDYIDSLHEYNCQFEEELRLDENILAIDSVEDDVYVADKISQMPWEVVAPYLVEQEDTETSSA